MAIRLTISKGPHLAIGLMSGTSHDGVSAALVELDERRTPQARLLGFKTYPYQARFRRRLMAVCEGAPVVTSEISALNFALGRALAQAALNLTRSAAVEPERLSFVGSHGHTFFHLPPRRARHGEIPSTLQLGEPAVIAASLGVPVVADFRPMDIALGGEGAPLTPLGHLRLFGDSVRGRVIQNIGGIGNATYLPPGTTADDPRLIAFDTGPGNVLIDALANRMTRGRARMDKDGRIAARGEVHEPLLGELMRYRYFARRPPKSTGREEFGEQFIARFAARARARRLSAESAIATATALTARSIALACRRFIAPLGPLHELIVTGGGARNPTLLAMLSREMPQVAVMRAEQAGVEGDAIEAIAFALLGYETLRGRAGNLPQVTGARASAILGKITLPPKPSS